MKKLSTILCLLAISFMAQAQIQYQWHKRLGAAGVTYEVIDYVTYDRAGNVYISGQNSSTITSDVSVDYTPGSGSTRNAFIVKLDPLGNLVWAKNFGPTSGNGSVMSIDGLDVDNATGRIYFCGRVGAGVADLDPGVGVVSVTSGQGVLGCLNSNGNFQWGGGLTNVPYIQSVRVRANGDPIFGATFFLGNGNNVDVDYSAGVGSMTVSASGVRYGAFLLQYSAAGVYQTYNQATSATPPNFANIYMHGASTNYQEDALLQDMEIDAAGNIFIAVNSPWYLINGANQNLQGKDMFIVKFNSSGVYQSHATFLNTITTNYNLNGIDLDAAGNIYATGHFVSTIDFDPGAATFNLNGCFVSTEAGFLLKLDNNLGFVNAVKIQSNLACGSITSADKTFGNDIAVSGSNVYVVGKWTGTVDFDPSVANATVTSSGGFDSYLASYSTALAYQSHATWGATVTSPNGETSDLIDVNASQEILVGSLMDADITDINPQAGTVPVALLGDRDGLVTKFYVCGEASSITTQPTASAVCSGRSTSFSVAAVGPALSYQWRKGGANISGATSNVYNIASASAGDAGNYDVVITSACGGAALTSTAAALTVDATPSATIAGTTTICRGESTILSVAPSSTYLWSNGVTTTSNAVTPTANTTYNVTVSSANGCSATGSQLVTVNTASVTITGSTAACPNTTATLTASANASYLWSNGATTQTITPTITATTVFRVTATAANGCTSTAAATVTMSTPAVFGISGGNTAVCPNTTVNLTTSAPFANYLWSTGATSMSVNVAPTTTTTYTVVVTGANGCTSSAAKTVTVTPAAATISGNTDICQGASTVLTGTGGGSYQWTSSLGGATTSTVTYTPSAAVTTVTLRITATNGCTASANTSIRTFRVTTSATPATGANFTNLCYGQNITVTAAPSYGTATFVWSDGQTTNSTVYNPTVSSSFAPIVTLTNTTNGCSATGAWSMTVAPSNPTISPTNPTLCSGGGTTLTASGGTSYLWNTGATTAAISVAPAATTPYRVTITSGACTAEARTTVTVQGALTTSISGNSNICSGTPTVLSATGGGTYVWSTGGTTSGITVTPTANTTYRVTVSQGSSCTATASLAVSVTSLPAAAITGPSVTCSGTPVSLTASGGGTYLWNTGATGSAISGSISSPTTFTVTVTNNGCSATASKFVNVNALPTVAVTGNNAICSGVSTTLTASGGGTYLWSTGATASTVTVAPTSNTTYVVTITGTNGCSTTASRAVTVTSSPALSITGDNLICSGESTSLTVTGANTYVWSNASTNASINVTPTATTTYRVTGTANGCNATASMSVTVTAAPSAAVTGATQVCTGSTTVVTATGGTSYLWQDGSTTSTLSVTPTANTTYRVTVTNAAGCTATAGRSISTFTPTVTITSTAPSAVCPSVQVTLNATGAGPGGATYRWSNGQTGNPTAVAPTATTNYTVTITDTPTGCTGTNTITVSVTNVTASITGGTAICTGSFTTLTATGGTTYAWSNGFSTSSVNVGVGSYQVIVSTANGCAATATVAVTALPTPTVTLSTPSAICMGGSATIAATGSATSFLWSNGETTSSINVTPTANTTYRVTVSSGNACTATASRVVAVNTVPTAAINGPTSICAGLSATLVASGGGTYVWSTGATTASINVTPTAQTTYDVTVTSAGGCTATASNTISVNSSPVASISGNSILCTGSSLVLTANGGNTYLWSNGATTSAITVTPTSNTTFVVTVSLGGGCTATASQAITISGLPTATITATSNSVCPGFTTTLTANGGATYLWSDGSTGNSISVAPTAITNYTVTVTSAAGCTASAIRGILINTVPFPFITGTLALCEGSPTNIEATGGVSYSWSNGSNIAQVMDSPTADITYTVTVTNAVGCTASASVNVTVSPIPAPVVVNNNGVLETGTFVSYQWYVDGRIINGATLQTYTPTVAGNYSVMVTGVGNCPAMSSTVNVLVGLDDIQLLEGVKAYPNPTDDLVNIEVMEANEPLSIQVFNLLGQSVGSYTSNSKVSSITLPNIQGIYLVQVTMGQRTATLRVTKN